MNLFLFAAIGVAICVYGVARGLEAIIKYQRDQNRSWVLRLDGDAGTYFMERRVIKTNHLRTGKGAKGRTEILEGNARYQPNPPVTKGKDAEFEPAGKLMGNRGALYMLHARHGWNLRVPRDQETVGVHEGLRSMSLCNPSSYYQAEHRNDSRDALDANQEPEPWYGRLAPFILIAVVVAMGMLGYVVVTLQGA